MLPTYTSLFWIANQSVSQTPRFCLNFIPLEVFFYFNSKDRGVGKGNGFSLGSWTLKICFWAIFQIVVSNSRLFQRRLCELININLWLLCFLPLGFALSWVSGSPSGLTMERKPERHEKYLSLSQGLFHTANGTGASGTAGDEGWVLNKNMKWTVILSFHSAILKQNGSSFLKCPRILCWRWGTRLEYNQPTLLILLYFS